MSKDDSFFLVLITWQVNGCDKCYTIGSDREFDSCPIHIMLNIEYTSKNTLNLKS